MGRKFLVVRIEQHDARIVGMPEVRAALAAGGSPVVMDLDAAWVRFREAMPYARRVFDVDALCECAGVSRDAGNKWLVVGALPPPSIAASRGRGNARAWAYVDCFIGGVVGTLGRQRVPLPLLTEICAGLLRLRLPFPAEHKERETVPA